MRTHSGFTRPTRVGSLVETMLARFGLLHNLNGWRIVNRWPDIVGDKIAQVSKAIRYSDNTLLVSVPDDTWRQQLSLEVDAILAKIHESAEGRVVHNIHFIS